MGLISLGDQLNRGGRRGTLGLSCGESQTAPSDSPVGVAGHLCLYPHHRTDRLSSFRPGPRGRLQHNKILLLGPSHSPL